MTTIIPFVPSNITTPKISVTLDGNPYTIFITWNVSAQRYYINVYDQSGNWIVTTALVSTPPARGVLNAVYDPFLNAVTVQLVDPSLWPVPLGNAGLLTPPGTIINYTMSGFSPSTYNGKFRCVHENQVTFSFPMPNDPGEIVILGTVNRMLDMIDPLFAISTLVYRNGAFEVNP
jgi:hypothetical protein